MKTALVCIGLLALLIFALGLAISMQRRKTKTSIGYPDDPASMLYKLGRAHGNATEFVPTFAILMLILAMRAEPPQWVQWTMIVATLARYSHAAGMILTPTLKRPHILRFLGSLFTYVTGFALIVALFVSL
jgi:uncharacterized membrane protein YecN with MAPEG domain